MTDDVKSFYDRGAESEWERLGRPFHQIEMRTTLNLLDRFVPHPCRIAEIGAGPGRYTVELLKRGHRVESLELSRNSVALARAMLHDQGLDGAKLHVGDARDLVPFETEGFDAALSLGPMYHLRDPDDRSAALQELRRILEPGGIALVAYLNAWGILRTALIDMPHWFEDDRAAKLMAPCDWSAAELPGFTSAHFSTPEAAQAELKSAGFEVLTYAGCEGFAGGMKRNVEHIATAVPAAMPGLLNLAVETSEHPAFRDATDHLCFVVQRL